MTVDGFPRTVVLHGTGLIGCSLGLALRARLPGVRVFGLDAPDVLAAARQRGAVEDGAAPAAADLTVLAAPVGEIVRLLQTLPLDNTLVLDVGSTKTTICETAARAGIAFVGGHPMAGSERSGPRAAWASLFEGTPFFLCPVASTPTGAVGKLSTLIRALGAQPVVLSPEEHDRLVAQTSHLPQLVATVLADQTAGGRELAGSGLKSSTRLAASKFHVWRDILATSPALPTELDDFIARLQSVREALRRKDAAALGSLFERANRAVADGEMDR